MCWAVGYVGACARPLVIMCLCALALLLQGSSAKSGGGSDVESGRAERRRAVVGVCQPLFPPGRGAHSHAEDVQAPPLGEQGHVRL